MCFDVVDEIGVDLWFEQSNMDNYGLFWLMLLIYIFEFGDNFFLEIIGLVSCEDWFDGLECFEMFFFLSGFVQVFIYEGEGEYKEMVICQIFLWNFKECYFVEFGGEIVINFCDISFSLVIDDGMLIIMFDLFVFDIMVEEICLELFVNYIWIVLDWISFESGLWYEFLEIEQIGDVEQLCFFIYVKFFFIFNYCQDEQNWYWIILCCDVVQLNFGCFVSQVDLIDNNFILGNLDYVFQCIWILEGEWECCFGDGFFLLVIGYDKIEDLDGWVLIEVNGFVFDVLGNIGDGLNFWVIINMIILFDDFGFFNVVIDVFLEYYDINVEDQLIMMDWYWFGYCMWELWLDYCQIFLESQFVWGWDYFWFLDGEVFCVQEYCVQGFIDGDFDFYVEIMCWLGLIFCVGVDVVINNGDDCEWVFYNGLCVDGIIDCIEYQNELMGKIFYICVCGIF